MWYLIRIWAQLRIIAEHFVTIGTILWSYAKTHRTVTGVSVAIVAIGIVALIYFTAVKPDDATPVLKSVTIIRVGDVSAREPLSVIGEIRATSEANVAPDSSGTVRAVYRQLGDFVGAGAVIAELDNGIQKAQVAQARATLEKVKGSVGAGELGISSAKDAYTSALSSGKNAVENAYATINDAVQRKTDSVFSNPRGAQPRFVPLTSDSQLVSSVESGRLSVQVILNRHTSASNAPEEPDLLLKELEMVSLETSRVQEFISNVVLALNSAIPTSSITEASIAIYRADANAALTSVTGLKSSVVSSIENIKIKRNQVAISESTLAQGTSGKSADVNSAEASLDAALAGLEKTIIRAPISGTINRLNLDVGNFVTASIPVVYIANARALEVVVYVSAKDLASVGRGQKASIAGLADGTVSKVAQALDPFTKKAEVRISIPSDSPFVSGQSATVLIARKVEQKQAGPLSIPISALKITPSGPIVFTVIDKTLVENPVVLGALSGSSITIESGVIADLLIVEDARGLKSGQQVTVSRKQ